MMEDRQHAVAHVEEYLYAYFYYRQDMLGRNTRSESRKAVAIAMSIRCGSRAPHDFKQAKLKFE